MWCAGKNEEKKLVINTKILKHTLQECVIISGRYSENNNIPGFTKELNSGYNIFLTFRKLTKTWG
jgi:hypothetical protein